MLKSAFTAVVISVALTCGAHASVMGLFNTGADLLVTTDGTADTHYTSGGNPLVTYYNGAYVPDNTTVGNQSLWLSTAADGGLPGDISVVTTTFISNGSYKISGVWGVDNSGSLYVTGSSGTTLVSTIDYGYPAFQSLKAFDFTVGAGTYTLQFALNNQEGPFALRVGDLAVAAVPEPSTWAMMILGFVGIGAMTYRRRNTASFAA